MNTHNYEMATPINSLPVQHNNINNLVKNVENNIETMNSKPLPQNLTYNPDLIILNMFNISKYLNINNN